MRIIGVTGLLVLLVGSSGCSMLLAFPDDKAQTTNLMPPSRPVHHVASGWPRERVHAKLGKPVRADACENGTSVELFEYRERHRTEGWGDWLFGYTRAFFHLGADLFTLFAWEIPGTAFEMYVMGDRHLFLVRYGADGTVERTRPLGRVGDQPAATDHCSGSRTA